MITMADLNDLREHPQVAYPQYGEIRAAARAMAMRPADPAGIPRMQQVIRDRGSDWCQSVLGWPATCSLRDMSGTDADMLMIAHERDLDPPLPGWLVQWRAESGELRARQQAAREAGLQRDRERWRLALATCGVFPAQLAVRPSVNGRRYRTVWNDGPLRHVVPAVDVRSARRRHRAGRPLCESVQRSKPRELGEPTGEPATCVNCIKYTAEIRPAGRSTS